MYTKTKKKSYHTYVPSLISKLTVIMFVLFPLMKTQKYNSKIERSLSWYET